MAKAKFGSLLLLAQGILVILFVVFLDDGKVQQPKYGDTFQGVGFTELHVSTFLGFGLIMTFLRRYSRGMLVHVFLIGTLIIQWATLLQGFFSMKNTKIDMGLKRMVNADYAVMSALVSLGAIMGKCNSLQLLAVAMLHTVFFTVNEAINIEIFQVSDFGRSMVVHMFGAYFGMAVSRMIFSRKVCMSQALSMSHKSEMFSFVGTLFLWVYWPSVNAIFVTDFPSKSRALTNTFYALAASCTASFSFTVLQSKESKFNFVHLQNASLAGGVAIGSIAAMALTPWGAVIVGIVGALGTVMGYKYLVPKLRRSLKIHDTRGVHATHGIPGILSGVASILVALLADENKYSHTLYKLYPARAPLTNSTKLLELQQFAPIPPGEDRKAWVQALYQFACLGVTMVTAVVGGLVTGAIIRFKFFDPVSVNDAFDDHDDFEEANCIDVVSDIEYGDDENGDGKHHDTVVQGKRRCDTSSVQNVADDVNTPSHSVHDLVENHVSPQVHMTSDVEMDVIGGKVEPNDDQQPLIVTDNNGSKPTAKNMDSSEPPTEESPLLQGDNTEIETTTVNA